MSISKTIFLRKTSKKFHIKRSSRKKTYSQLFRKLFGHIIYGNIKTRYNVFRKIEYDVFGEYDFVVQKLLKSYIIRLFAKPPRSEALKSCLLHRDDGLDRCW